MRRTNYLSMTQQKVKNGILILTLKTPLAGVEVQIGSEVDPLLELARVKEEREKVFGKKSNFLRRRGLDPYAGI